MLFAYAAGSPALAYGYMLEWIGPCDHVDTLFKAEVRAALEDHFRPWCSYFPGLWPRPTAAWTVRVGAGLASE